LSSISRSDPDLRFGLVNGDLVIAVVDLREQFTRGDMLIISDGHVRDVTFGAIEKLRAAMKASSVDS
jgi:hypothetical protein